MRLASSGSLIGHVARVVLVVFSAMIAILVGIASLLAPSVAGAENRVGASSLTVEPLVGPPEHVSAGQRLGNDAAGPEIVVATGVAANAASGARLAEDLSAAQLANPLVDSPSAARYSDDLRDAATTSRHLDAAPTNSKKVDDTKVTVTNDVDEAGQGTAAKIDRSTVGNGDRGLSSTAGTSSQHAASSGAGLSDDLARLANQNVTGRGDTVLGSYPGYISKAKSKGASYFDIGDDWDSLVARGQDPWALNQHFLDGRIAAGDRILLSKPKGDIVPGTYLAREVEHLTNNGYRWTNQWSLRPGN